MSFQEHNTITLAANKPLTSCPQIRQANHKIKAPLSHFKTKFLQKSYTTHTRNNKENFKARDMTENYQVK